MHARGQVGRRHRAPAPASGGPRRCASPRRAPRSSSPTSTLDGAKETVRLIEEAGGVAVADRVRRVAGRARSTRPSIAAAVEHFGRLDIIFNNVGIPTPRLGLIFEEHTVDDFDRLVAVNAGGVFLGCKHAVIQFKEQGDGGVILNTGSVAGLVGWGGTVYGATKGAVHQLTKAVGHRGRAVRHPGATRSARRGCRSPNFTAAGGMTVSRRGQASTRWRERVGAMHPLGRPITAEDCAEAAVYLVSDRGQEHHRRAPAGRRRVRRQMTGAERRPDCSTASELRRLFDLRSSYNAHSGGGYTDDPYPSGTSCASRRRCTRASCTSSPATRATRSSRACRIPDRPHFSAFSFEACDAAFRDAEVFASSPDADEPSTPATSAWSTACWPWAAPSTGATARSCSRRSCRPRRSGGSTTGSSRRSHALIDEFVDDGRAELNVDFAAAIPVLTITGSFGVPRRAGARSSASRSSATRCEVVEILEPIVAARREQPADDLISVLVEAEYTDEDGVDAPPHRRRDLLVRHAAARRRIRARRGSRWASPSPRSSQRPDVLDAVQRRPRRCCGRRSRSRCGGCPPTRCSRATSPRDIDFFGVHLPEGSVLHLCLGAANRDPARWERPDEYDITRAAEAVARVRQRSARVPRHARRPRRDERRHQRAARPPAEPAARSRRRAARASSACTSGAPPRSRSSSR